MMPWRFAVAVAAVVDVMFAIALVRSERAYYRGSTSRDMHRAAFREFEPEEQPAAPKEPVRWRTNPASVIAILPGVHAVTSPGSDMVH